MTSHFEVMLIGNKIGFCEIKSVQLTSLSNSEHTVGALQELANFRNI